MRFAAVHESGIWHSAYVAIRLGAGCSRRECGLDMLILSLSADPHRTYCAPVNTAQRRRIKVLSKINRSAHPIPTNQSRKDMESHGSSSQQPRES